MASTCCQSVADSFALPASTEGRFPSTNNIADVADDHGLSSSSKFRVRLKPVILDPDGDIDTIETVSKQPTSSADFLPSSSRRSSARAVDGHSTSAAVTPSGKKYLWKNIPPWSPLYHRAQQRRTALFHDLIAVALHADADSPRFLATEVEPPPQALLAEGSEVPPEVVEILAVTLQDRQYEEGDYRGVDEQDRDRKTRTAEDALTIAGDGDLEVGAVGSAASGRPCNKHGEDYVEMDNSQRTDRTAPTAETDEVPLSIAECAEQTPTSFTIPASSSANAGEDGAPTIDIPASTTSEALDKRSSASGVEYKLTKKARVGRAHTEDYEKELVRVRRLGTLRARKRKLSQM